MRFANAAAMERLNGYVSERESVAKSESVEESPKRREYKRDENVEFLDEDGNLVYGVIAQEPDAANGDVVWVDYYKTPERYGAPYRMNALEREAFDGMIVDPSGIDSLDVADRDYTDTDTDTDNRDTDSIDTEDNEMERAMPMVEVKGKKKPDWNNASPVRAHAYLYNERGLSRENADAFVENNLKAAESALEKLRKKQPEIGTDLDEFEEMTADWQRKVSEVQARAEYWRQVKDEQRKVIAAEAHARAEREAAIQEQAAIEERQRQEAESRKREEQARLGSNNVSPRITEKWNAAPKVEGARNEITLANGERVAGQYVLVESGAATPSHNPSAEFVKNDGFPVDENGNTVNDRDYERDREARDITRQTGANYDSRAIQNVPVVSKDGVVLSGNGRTMAGELAAQNGTDGAYIEHLRKYGGQFGFTSEQVESMSHPRVLFVPDSDMPYTTDTFAKFNAQEMKSQSRTEQSVKLGKTVDDATFNRVVRSINGFDTIGDFYNDTTASTEAIAELRNAGAINSMQYAEMFDGDKVSGVGRQMLENMLIGKAFASHPDAIRQLSEYPSMRQSVISALAEIINNLGFGEGYSLESELSQAIDLVYQARKNGYKSGEAVSDYARQLNLFPFDMGETVSDYTNATVLMLADVLNDSRVSLLKKTLIMYNRAAADSAAGQMDLFSGSINGKQEIIKEVLDTLNYGTQLEQQAALAEAVERRKAEAAESATGSDSVQQNGVDGAVRAGGEEELQSLTRDKAISIIAQMEERAEEAPEIELTVENWDAQFGHDGSVKTPIGDVKMGENQFIKLMRQGRKGKLGMIKPTLENPDVIIEDTSKAKEDDITERNSSYVFVKAFKKADGSRYYYFTSVTVSKDGKEVVISNQEKRRNAIANLLTKGKLVWKHADDVSAASDVEQGLYSPQGNMSDPTSESTDAPQTNDTSVGKGNENSAPEQEKGEKNTSIAIAEAETDKNPTDGQKEAGNYKKGHVKIDGLDISIENPRGSERSGTDSDGNPWSVKMNNTYGYIRRTEGVDGDHIDVFLSDDLDNWKGTVYVVDQVKTDGVFDEHKVMYGFNSEEEARSAYLSNYSGGWQGLGAITGVSKDDFKKWIDSSHRKTKAFSEYKSVKAVEEDERESERLQKKSTEGDKDAAGSSDVALRDALVGRLRDSGIDVVTDIEEGQRVLDEANGGASKHAKKRALETASLESDSRSLTVVSSADGAKVLKNLETTIQTLENSSTQPKTFIGDVAKALGAKRHNSKSEYATFETKNGKIVTIRLSDHNAKVSNFDNRGELDGISIVVSPKKNDGIINDGEAHVVEYYYDAIKLRRADGSPLADIVRSIQQALYSGEFIDTTGLGVRQEVNSNEEDVHEQSGDTRYFRTASGEAYGFVKDGKIYIDPRIAKSDTPIHEYAHLWSEALRQGNADEWKHVVELMKGTSVWDDVKSGYPELKTDDDIADEVIAQYSGKRGAERLRNAREASLRGDGDVMDKAVAVGALERVKEALNKFWHDVADFLHIRYDSADDVADMVLKDLLDGVNPDTEARKSRQLDRIHETDKNGGNAGQSLRMQIIGENGAERLDRSDEATVRMDNLSVAKQMDEAFNSKKERIERLRNSEPVIVSFNNEYELNRESAKEWAKSNLRGEYRNNDTGETITLSKIGVNKVTSHGERDIAHLKSISAIPQLIENSVFIEELPNEKDNDKYDSYRYYVCGLKIGGIDYTAKVVVGVKGDSKYYDHRLTEIEKGTLIDNLNGLANSVVENQNALNSDGKDTKLMSILQTNEQENARRIKIATGWERGADGKWRYEDGDITESDDPESSDDLTRVGTGHQSDDDVSLANDPWGKMWGESFRTKERKKSFAERERGNMLDHVRSLVERLHLDNVEIVADASGLSGKRALAKGFYNKKTGKITIVLSNHSSVADVEQTLLHEAVAHYGLRQLFGKQFDTFLDNVYASADESIRRKIAEMAARNGWDFRTATEEYLASLAEYTNFEDMNVSWWRDIKRLFVEFLHDIGFSGYSDLGLELSDNELRYILWRSYENLAEPGRYRSILGEAADVAMQDKLKVGNYAESVDNEATKVAEESIMDVNQRFNEELDRLTEENSDKVMLSLGRPSAVLRAAGVTDMPMKLYGNKVIKKMKKHGFGLDELRDLPRAVANPIAVFKNYGKDGNRSVLTELQTEQGNFLVTLSVGKGNDIDFNIVTSVFGKGEDNIVDWINRDFATYINKQKTLDYLHHSALKAVTSDNREDEKVPGNLRVSAPIAEAQSNQELNSAAKVIENFENPSIFDEKKDDIDVLFRAGAFSERDRVTARDEYERMVSSGRNQFIEAVQDSMMGLKSLYQSILGKGTRTTFLKNRLLLLK